MNFDWFLQREKREQIILTVGAVLLLVYILIVLLWRPLASDNRQLLDRNERAQEALQWMHNSAATIKAAKITTPGKTTGLSLVQLLDSSVQKYQLKFSRFQPRGAQRAQVWFDGASFSKLFAWLDALEKQGVSASSVSITATREEGLVSASLQLQKN